MSLLASLAFVLAAIVTATVLLLTIVRYRDAVLANLAALRDCIDDREFRVQALSVVVRQGGGDVRRIASRGPARRVKLPARLRAAA